MTTAPATTDDGFTTETWVFLGPRRGSRGKRVTGWRAADGEELFYTERASWIVGGLYAVPVKREGDQAIRRAPKYTGERIGREEAAVLEAASAAAEARMAQEARERKHKSQSALDEALAPLEAIARTLRTGADRDAFAAHVLRRISGSWR